MSDYHDDDYLPPIDRDMEDELDEQIREDELLLEDDDNESGI